MSMFSLYIITGLYNRVFGIVSTQPIKKKKKHPTLFHRREKTRILSGDPLQSSGAGDAVRRAGGTASHLARPVGSTLGRSQHSNLPYEALWLPTPTPKPEPRPHHPHDPGGPESFFLSLLPTTTPLLPPASWLPPARSSS